VVRDSDGVFDLIRQKISYYILPFDGHFLGKSGVQTTVSAWRSAGDEEHNGAQIDMLIFRKDHVVNLCEMKFSETPYMIDKDEEMRLRTRIESLRSHLSPRQTIHLTMVTTYGIAVGKHSGIVQSQVTMDDLFE
jgi:hypothetical protein